MHRPRPTLPQMAAFVRHRIIAPLERNIDAAARCNALNPQCAPIDTEWDLVQLHRARNMLATLEAGESVAAARLIDEFVAYCAANPTMEF